MGRGRAKLGRTALAILALLRVALAGQYADYQPLAASGYPSFQEQQGIRLAVVPLFDRSSQKRYFGLNLLAQGFLPVYVVIENHANAQSAILLRDRIVCKLDDSPPVSQDPQHPRPVPSDSAQAMALLAVQTLNIAGMLNAMSIGSSISNARMNLMKKELRSQTFSPGKSGGGFVFVPVGKGGKSVREVFLDVPVKAGPPDQDIHFNFRIEMRSGK
jgi:hypothetical protein